MCKQEQGKTIRSYAKHFFDTRATIPNVADEDVIHYFQSGITVQSLCRDFGRNRPKTVVQLRDMMQRWADEEDQERSRSRAVTTTTKRSVTTTVEAQQPTGSRAQAQA